MHIGQDPFCTSQWSMHSRWNLPPCFFSPAKSQSSTALGVCAYMCRHGSVRNSWFCEYASRQTTHSLEPSGSRSMSEACSCCVGQRSIADDDAAVGVGVPNRSSSCSYDRLSISSSPGKYHSPHQPKRAHTCTHVHMHTRTHPQTELVAGSREDNAAVRWTIECGKPAQHDLLHIGPTTRSTSAPRLALHRPHDSLHIGSTSSVQSVWGYTTESNED